MNGDRLTIRLPSDLKKKAEAKAKCEDITLSQVLRRCLREWVAEDEQPKESNRETK
jgi:predicted transcriptional regulator